MGKRKSAKKPMARKGNEPLATTFKCLFCHHEKTVSCKLDRQSMFGSLHCKTCGQDFSAPINNLSAAVDVYCDWVDACEETRKKQPPKKVVKQPPSRRSASPERRPSRASSKRPSRDYSDEEDDDEDYDRRRKVARDYDDEDDD